MIYFVINNDFHLSHIEKYSELIEKSQCFCISIPHSLKGDVDTVSANGLLVETPFRSRLKFWNPLHFCRAKNRIKTINFKSTDKLVLLTEYDPLNQYVAYRAKLAGAKVYILEEGIATYCSVISADSELLSARELLKLLYLRYVIGFRFLRFLKMGNNIFPRMNDVFIDAILLYQRVKVKRMIKTIIISDPVEKLDKLADDSCLFLSQPLYGIYMSEEEYLQLLELASEALSAQFKKVFFKFHPREHEYMESDILNVLNKYPNIQIVPLDYSIEVVAEKFRPRYASSFFSDALFKLDSVGITPIFLFHLFPELKENEVLIRLSLVLESMEYQSCPELGNLIKGPNNLRADLLLSEVRPSLQDIVC